MFISKAAYQGVNSRSGSNALIHDTFGHLRSYHYPLFYPSGLTCDWLIQAPKSESTRELEGLGRFQLHKGVYVRINDMAIEGPFDDCKHDYLVYIF